MKIDLKQTTNQPFVNWCKKNGANFVNTTSEGSTAGWVMPETYGDVRLGVSFDEVTGTAIMGEGDDIENQFIPRAVGYLFQAEQVWLADVLSKIASYNQPATTKTRAKAKYR